MSFANSLFAAKTSSAIFISWQSWQSTSILKWSNSGTVFKEISMPGIPVQKHICGKYAWNVVIFIFGNFFCNFTGIVVQRCFKTCFWQAKGLLVCWVATLRRFFCVTRLNWSSKNIKKEARSTLVDIYIFRNNDREISTIYFTGLAAKFCETLFILLVVKLKFELTQLHQCLSNLR